MNKNDFVYTLNKDGTVQSGGYKIDSILLSQSDSFYNLKNTDCTQKQNGGVNIDNTIFENLGVPAGLVTINGGRSENHSKTIAKEFIDDTLYSKLIRLSSGNENTNKNSVRKSRKQKTHSVKRTRKVTKK